jgi:hypothetical protein
MTARIDLNVPRELWTAQDSLRLGQNMLAVIKMRTSEGLDADGQPFKKYSTKPLYVAKRGARLTPKGGRPSRTGKSVYYAGGYQEYKQESRRRQSMPVTQSGAGQSAEVDLVLSGNLMNNLIVTEATQNHFKIGLTRQVQNYGYAVNKTREYIGLTDDEVDILVESIRFDMLEKLQ